MSRPSSRAPSRSVWPGPGAGSQRGDFDQVYRQTLSDGRIRYIVVEAKGGTSPLDTKVVGPNVETQGTADYFESTAESMKGMGGNAGTVGKELLSVYRKSQTLEKSRPRLFTCRCARQRVHPVAARPCRW